MWFQFLMYDNVWGWIFGALIIWSEFLCVHKDAGFQFLLIAFGSAIALLLFSPYNIFAWMSMHPVISTIGVVGYVFIGAVWGTVQWKRYGRRMSRDYRNLRDEFIQNREVTDGSHPTKWRHDHQDAFWMEVKHRWDRVYNQTLPATISIKSLAPLVRRNKNMITTWMSAWPLDFIWTFISDFVIEMWNNLVEYMRTFLQNIVNKEFTEFE